MFKLCFFQKEKKRKVYSHTPQDIIKEIRRLVGTSGRVNLKLK